MRRFTSGARSLTRYGPYVWPLRVPVLSALALLGLPWVAFWPAVRPLLSGLFDPLTERALLLITIAALFNAWTIVITSRLVLAYGAVRLDLPPVTRQFFPIPWWTWPASIVMVVPLLGRVLWYASSASERHVWAMAGYITAGALLATALLWATLTISGGLERRAERLRAFPPQSRVERAYVALLAVVSRWPALSEGFLSPVAHRRGAELGRGHGLALLLGSASLALYVLTGFLTRDIQRPQLASTLTYWLLLQLSLTWMLGFAAFLFDRTRVPLAVVLLLWIAVVNGVIDRWFPTDHIYRTHALPGAAPTRAAPGALIAPGGHEIVVAASGGGIQAAAWTARVLTGLQQAIPEFSSRLRLVSAVSGGSVGAMNFLAGVEGCGPEIPAGAAEPFDADLASRESSLHAVGWGVVFKDLPRTIAPFFSNPYVDRGSVLEDAWKRERRLQMPLPSTAALLSSWRRNVAERRCPGVVYNAMAVETGEPFLFSTVALPPDLRFFDFYGRYPDRDVAVTTAVRLSATFPYVAPASRADLDDERGRYLHVVDGGYYDNYGITTLVAWVHAALSASPAAAATRVLVIEICDSAECSSAEPAAPSTGGPRRAWPYQLIAPIAGLLATRSTAQQVNNRAAVGLLRRYWEQRTVCIDAVAVPFVGEPGPLSWHLTETQKSAVADAWTSRGEGVIAAVRAFLQAPAAAGDGVCADTRVR